MEKLYSAVLILLCVFTLHACGSNSGDGENNNTAQTGGDEITLSNDELKNRAINSFGDNLNAGASSAGSVTTDAGDTLAGEQPIDEPTAPTENDTEFVNEDTLDLIASSMALGDETGGRTTREGNRLIIDPDETEVCAERNAGNDTQAEIQRCENLVRDMTVIVDANSDTSGTVTYSYLNQEVINYSYSETTDSFEVQLEGLKTLSDAEDDLNPESFGDAASPDVASGALSFSATTTNSTPGAEAGSIRLDVTRAISVESDNQNSFSIGTGTILSVSADEAGDSGRIELDIGEVILNSVDDSNTKYDLKGLTAIIESSMDSDTLVVQNLSLGRGPLQLSVNNELVSELSLDTLGFSINNENGLITIDTNLNFRSLINETSMDGMGNSETLQTILEVMAPSGSTFLDQDNGALKVLQGGPLGYTLTEPDSNRNPVATMVTVAAGQCFEDNTGPEEKPAIVNCDL
ncbi:MAG: hypothetical protein AB8B63_08815 [Granulosicoccus sp.]